MKEKIVIHILAFLVPVFYYWLYTYLAVLHQESSTLAAVLCGIAGGVTLIGLLARLDRIGEGRK